MKSTLVPILVAALVPGAACPVSAQAPTGTRGPTVVRVVPRIGLVSPDAYLYEQFANFSGDGPVEWTSGHLGRAVVVGLGVEVGRTGGSVFLRGEILRSVSGWLSAAHSIVVPRQLFDPPRVETTWLDVPTAITLTSLHLVFPTRLTLGPVEPYVLAGVGGKNYDFGTPSAANDAGAILPEGGFTWAGDVGAGFAVAVLGLTIDLQGRDVINRYWGKTQHDLVFSAGIVWRIR